MKTFISACVAAAFLVASIYCCCFSSIQWNKNKHSCCQTKSSSPQKTANHDCPHCNSTFNAELSVKDAHDIQPAAAFLTLALDHVKASRVPVAIGTSLFINGPPGPRYHLPLYIQNPSLRL